MTDSARMASQVRPERGDRTWTFLTNHAVVLLCIAQDPAIRMRDIAEQAGITERAAGGIVRDLVEAGYMSRTRVGRRNRYAVHTDRPMRHRSQRHLAVQSLLGVLGGAGATS